MEQSYLIHFGIKGQKWGFRRWQNSDGTFNEAGKKKYFGFKSKSEKSNYNYRNNDKSSKSEKAKNIAKGVLAGVTLAAVAYGGYKFAQTETGQRMINNVIQKTKAAGTEIRNQINIQRGRNQINRQFRSDNNGQNPNRIHDALRNRSRQIQQDPNSGTIHNALNRVNAYNQGVNERNGLNSANNASNSNTVNNLQNARNALNRYTNAVNDVGNQARNTAQNISNRINNRNSNTRRYDERDRSVLNYRMGKVKDSFNRARQAATEAKTNPYVQRDTARLKRAVDKENRANQQNFNEYMRRVNAASSSADRVSKAGTNARKRFGK